MDPVHQTAHVGGAWVRVGGCVRGWGAGDRVACRAPANDQRCSFPPTPTLLIPALPPCPRSASCFPQNQISPWDTAFWQRQPSDPGWLPPACLPARMPACPLALWGAYIKHAQTHSHATPQVCLFRIDRLYPPPPYISSISQTTSSFWTRVGSRLRPTTTSPRWVGGGGRAGGQAGQVDVRCGAPTD